MSQPRPPLAFVPVPVAPNVLSLPLFLVIVVVTLEMKLIALHPQIFLHLKFGPRLLAGVLAPALSATVHPVTLVPAHVPPC